MSKNGICEISKKSFSINNLIEGRNIRSHLFAMVQKDHPEFNENSLICIAELNKYRKKYLEIILTDEAGELSKIEQEVIESINANEVLSDNIEFNITTKITFGQRIADNVARFGGSWKFIIGFFSFLTL